MGTCIVATSGKVNKLDTGYYVVIRIRLVTVLVMVMVRMRIRIRMRTLISSKDIGRMACYGQRRGLCRRSRSQWWVG